MLFDIRQFEHHFEERELKKALKLFTNEGVELLEKINLSEQKFNCSGEQVHLRKKADKLLSYHCSCHAHLYCKHLGAVLFFMQKETLGLLARKKASGKIKSRRGIAIKNIPLSALHDFLYPGLSKKTGPNQVEVLLFNINEHDSFETYSGLLKRLLTPYYSSGKLNQPQIREVQEFLQLFITKAGKMSPAFNASYYFHLALLAELQNLLLLRFTGDETTLVELKTNCIKILDGFFKKGLKHKEKLVWQATLFLSLRNNFVIRDKTYSFLLPRFLTWSRSKPVFDDLRTLLSKRKNSSPDSGRFNHLLIAGIQLKIREREVFKTKLSRPDIEEMMEEKMAGIELAFCRGKLHKAFELIESGMEIVLTSHKLYFDEYTHYVIQQSRVHNKPEVEARYLRERIIKGLYLRENELERWLGLLKDEEVEKKIHEVIVELKMPRYYSFDKLSLILQKTNQLDELTNEIKKQDNAYRLLHKVVMLKLPAFDKGLLLLYVKHFIGAISVLRLYNKQQMLFETAREYIDQLPEEASLLILDKIITHSGSESQMSRHIRDMYGL